jgi:GntR family transcriptional regulator/MocR family aminotransferase
VQVLAWPVLGDTAGLHVVLELPASHPAELLVAAAAARGIALHAVNRYYAGPPTLNALCGFQDIASLKAAGCEQVAGA